MEFNRNKTTVEEIREIKFGGTYFGDNCSGVNRKWYRNLWKEFTVLKNIY